MTVLTISPAQSRLHPSGPSFATVGRSLFATIALWDMRARSRAALARVDASLHADLGLGAADVRREVAKPFWRA